MFFFIPRAASKGKLEMATHLGNSGSSGPNLGCDAVEAALNLWYGSVGVSNMVLKDTLVDGFGVEAS